ncbi:MAG: ACP S-malonyltransferase [Candidatus Eremiobacteraeota bacterium]|nr:ACP S-malonyltransferase [Candidatus Eremiobacteraeota bacterium]
MRVGVIFPGQGSQVVGMGAEIAAWAPAAAELFERAAPIVGYDLLALCREGPEERLRDTKYSQPAIFVTNCALAAAVTENEGRFVPVVSAGHSFGEYCSLVLAASLDFDAALALVNARGTAMQHAAELVAGGMAAVLGLDADEIEAAVEQVRSDGGRVQLANFNAPSQIVISGELEAVRRAGDLCLEAGAKRVVPLNVAGAWHSELMDPAVPVFAPYVERARVALPKFDVISNVDAEPYRDVAHIKENLVRSVTAEVLWHATSLRLLESELDLVVEFGASPVLGPMLRRLAGAPEIVSVSDRAGIEKLHAKLGAPAPAH